jgi:hypothetical protein
MFRMSFLAQPGKVETTFDFSTIDWWWYVLTLIAVFAIVGAAGKQKWCWYAILVMVGWGLGYAFFMTKILPAIS